MATKKFIVTGDQYRVIDRRFREIKRQLDQEDGSPLNPDWVASELQRVVEGQRSNEVYPIIVDYGQSLADMIAAGHYDWVNNDITQNHFPITGEGRVEVEQVLVHLNRSASTDDVLKELESRELRPATIAEFLAFGAKYPDKQREFPIIAIGSVWAHPNGDRRVVCLYESVSKRGLSMDWCESRWHGHYRFLASRK